MDGLEGGCLLRLPQNRDSRLLEFKWIKNINTCTGLQRILSCILTYLDRVISWQTACCLLDKLKDWNYLSSLRSRNSGIEASGTGVAPDIGDRVLLWLSTGRRYREYGQPCGSVTKRTRMSMTRISLATYCKGQMVSGTGIVET